jgi:LPLT family lysophospholipid transporter-like MFS transporter
MRAMEIPPGSGRAIIDSYLSDAAAVAAIFTPTQSCAPARIRKGAPLNQAAAASRLWSRGLIATLCAQFLSALADNALIFAALALVHKESYPNWTGPLLQEFFIVTYVVLAPFVGAFADMHPKGRVLLYANVVKLAGALGMCLKLNPFLSYAIVGAGAAAYSPAKYGILTELTSPQLLVKANSLIESATIASILLGAVSGGVLTDWSIEGALVAIAACYAAAGVSTLLIPRLKAARRRASFAAGASIKAFAAQTGSFLKSPTMRAALIGTGIFWGAGAALRFLLIAWVPAAFNITKSSVPGYLTGMVAAGIAVGAVLAGRFVKVQSAHRALPAGILLGIGVSLLPLIHRLPAAFLLMAFVGICSGFLVVPLDAVLQKRGNERGGVGSAVAIQNLFENLCMLVFMSAYAAAIGAGVPVNIIALGFGVLIAVSMATLTLTRPKRSHL